VQATNEAHCKHNRKLRKDGLCKDCTLAKPYTVYRWCLDKKCPGNFAGTGTGTCNHTGYFWGPAAPEKMRDQPATWTSQPSKIMYTADMVKTSLALQWDHYYAQLAIGQSPTWKCDERTATLYCLSQWVMNVLIELNCPQEDRLKLQNFWNRKSRAEDELYAVAALTINNFLQGKIEPLPFHKK
jgi:hypothetical protein